MPIAADQFPRPLLSLDDAGLSALMAASAPLQPNDRSIFLALVAVGLQTLPAVGPGALHELIAEAQHEFLKARALDGTTGKPAKPAPPAKRGPRSREHGYGGWIFRRGRRRKATPST